MHRWLAIAFAVGISSLSASAQAAEPKVTRLGYDARVDGAITATGAIWLATAEILKPELVPEKCRWCYRAKNGDSTLNVVDFEVRSALKWDRTETAADISSGVAFVFMPLAAVGLPAAAAGYDKHLRYAPIDALLVAEATILAADLNELVKYLFVRERPYAHALPHLPDGIKGLTESPTDANLSFYSGHTNLAFAMAASSAAVAFMRGYRLAPMILGVQGASAISVGYLRIAADKHYLSDVMVGAVLGTLIGAFVPILFHGPSPVDVQNATSATPQAMRIGSAPFNFTGHF